MIDAPAYVSRVVLGFVWCLDCDSCRSSGHIYSLSADNRSLRLFRLGFDADVSCLGSNETINN